MYLTHKFYNSYCIDINIVIRITLISITVFILNVFVFRFYRLGVKTLNRFD